MELPGMKKREKDKITQHKAFEILLDWYELLEIRLTPEDFGEVQKELWRVVSTERLSFDRESEIFTYVLKRPIKDRGDGKVLYSMIKMQDCDMNSKSEYQKIKDDFSRGVGMLQAFCSDSEGKEIPSGFLSRLFTADEINISAVILGFFAQAVPGLKGSE